MSAGGASAAGAGAGAAAPVGAGAGAGARLLVRDDGAVRILLLSRPERRNAIDRGLLAALVRALPAAPPGPDQPIRAVVLAGDPAGGAFSAGFDLGALEADVGAGGAAGAGGAGDAGGADPGDPIDGPARALEEGHVPVIAALEGAAFGGALELAAASDLRVAAAGARLCLPPSRLGLGYALGGLARIVRLVGRGGALRLFLAGEVIDAAEALRLGLVERVVADGQALPEAIALAGRIADGAPLAVLAMRRAIHALARPAAALDKETRAALESLRARTLASADLAEGLRAFRERRPPRFEGR